MSEVENILAYAWNKDAASLKPALDDILTSRAADVIANMTADVAASMFGATSATSEDNNVVMDDPQVETSDFETDHNEGITDAEEV